MKQEDTSKLVVTLHSRDSECNVAVRDLDDVVTINLKIVTPHNKLRHALHLPERPAPRGKHFGSIIEPSVSPRAVGLTCFENPAIAALSRVLY